MPTLVSASAAALFRLAHSACKLLTTAGGRHHALGEGVVDAVEEKDVKHLRRVVRAVGVHAGVALVPGCMRVPCGKGASRSWSLFGRTWIAGSTTPNVWSCKKVDLPA